MRQLRCFLHRPPVPWWRRAVAAVLAGSAGLSLAGGVPCGAGASDPWVHGTDRDGLIADPLAWTARHLLDDPAATAEGAGIESFQEDLDHDGNPELFVDAAPTRGQRSSPHLVFRRDVGGYRYLGSIDLHALGQAFLRVLPPGPDGLPRLLTYASGSGPEAGGTLQTYVWDGCAFRRVHEERLEASEPGLGVRLLRTFGHGAAAPGR